jgi:hypothetical protein
LIGKVNLRQATIGGGGAGIWPGGGAISEPHGGTHGRYSF